MTINVYTQADADQLSKLLDLTGVTAKVDVIAVDPVNKPGTVVWHFAIDEV